MQLSAVEDRGGTNRKEAVFDSTDVTEAVKR
jgi:hypothetical protein